MSDVGANRAGSAPAGTGSSGASDFAPPTSAFDRLEALSGPAANAGGSATGTPATETTATGTPATDSFPAAPPLHRDTQRVEVPRLTRRGRVRKWDRPKQPMDWRFWVGNLGKTLIATGLLMFAFVAYQLWGTGIETARAQSALESEFDALLADAPPIDLSDSRPGDQLDDQLDGADPVGVDDPAEPDDEVPSTEPTAPGAGEPSATPLTTVAPIPAEQQSLPPDLENGEALARLVIPRLDRSDIVVAGVDKGDLKRGPGHFPDTPLPGQLGNAAIAGHRTTYGAPFFDIDDMQVGDEIIAETLNGRFTYSVTGLQIVEATDYWVVSTEDPSRATLTLVSCHPKYTAQKRIVVFSELISTESSPVGEPIINYGRPEEPTPPETDDDESDIDIAVELPGAPDADGTDPDDTGTGQTVPATPTPADGSVTGNVGDVTVVEAPTELAAGQVSEEIVDAFSGGWFSDPAANSQVGLWGALLALVGIGAYLISRQLRRDWVGAMVGIVPFLVTLYFFFQNVNRLLPANL